MRLFNLGNLYFSPQEGGAGGALIFFRVMCALIQGRRKLKGTLNWSCTVKINSLTIFFSITLLMIGRICKSLPNFQMWLVEMMCFQLSIGFQYFPYHPWSLLANEALCTEILKTFYSKLTQVLLQIHRLFSLFAHLFKIKTFDKCLICGYEISMYT